jgi:Secretion system C-terminal sorting domain
MKQKSILILILAGSAFFKINAQSSVHASGGSATGATGKVEYSVGQTNYTSTINASGSVLEGVQQAYEVFVVSGLKDQSPSTINYEVFPNPTTNQINLRIDHQNLEKVSYQLLDAAGKILVKEKVASNQTSIGMEGYASAIYYLHILENSKQIKVFKIIKN